VDYRRTQWIVLVLLSVVLLGSGCVSDLMIDLMADAREEASPAFAEHWDYELAGEVIPGSILTLEGTARLSPDNETVLTQLIRAYTGYAYGWVEDEMEVAMARGDYARAAELRNRARFMYQRARDLGQHLLALHDDGFDEAYGAGFLTFEAWVHETFDEREDAAVLMWAGDPWGLHIKAGVDDPSAVADLSFMRALVERAVELDPEYSNATGLTLLATIEATIPAALGGQPERSEELFERALSITERKTLLVHVNYAMSYAVNTANRELFVSLLNEVLTAGDLSPQNRMMNQIARRRAQRAMARLDELFEP
jgi:hypothetical protein